MLQHVSVEIRPDQEEACLAFWKLLGFEQMTPPPILRGHVTWVQRNGTQIHFLHTDDPKATAQGHGAVVVDDYERTLAALEQAGHEIREGSNAWDAPRSFVRDPAGNLFEVMSKSPQPPWPGE
jgi:catechol 2,3-dioxygenase-like lactoylglutathione lyase family enzyme